MTDSNSKYIEWDDLKNEVRLYNGTTWLTFNRAALATPEQMLRVVEQLLEDPGIQKEQILILLSSCSTK